MSRNPLEELAILVEGFDEDQYNYREVRAAKRLIRDLIKADEATMSRNPLEELAILVEGFDEDQYNYREVRAAKRLIRDLITADEATK